MTRTTPLLLLALLAACSEGPELMAPEAPVNEPPAQELIAGDPILDALDRIVPGIEDRSVAAELQVALLGAKTDPRGVERILARLESNLAMAPDVDAIRFAIAAR